MKGYEYHDKTKYSRSRFGGRSWVRGGKPELFKSYSGVPLFELPQQISWPEKNLWDVLFRKETRDLCCEISLEVISVFLSLSYGIRSLRWSDGGYPFRVVPSAGALYPCELYAVVGCVTGLPQGIYHYRSDIHALEELGEVDGHGLFIDTWVSAIPYRSACKYQERALRYVLLDSGHLLEQIRIAGGIIGLEGQSYSGFDNPEALENAVGIDEKHEILIGGVRFGDGRYPIEFELTNDIEHLRRLSAKASGGDFGLVIRDVLDSIRWGRIVFEDLDESESVFPKGALPPVSAIEATLRRRSRRRYKKDILNCDYFEIFLKIIGGIALSPGLVVHIVVERVDGIVSGVYKVVPSDASSSNGQMLELVMLNSGNFIDDLAIACLGQTWISSGAFTFIIGINNSEADEVYGSVGYRHVLLNAGRIGQRIYMTSEGLGLGCCGVGAFYDDDVARVASMSGGVVPVYVVPVGSV